MKTLEQRIKILQDLGLVFDENKRNFTGKAGKVDMDVVQYGSEELFDKQVKRLKI